MQLHQKYKGFSGEQRDIEAFAREALSLPKMEEWGLSTEELAEDLIGRRPRTYSEIVAGVYAHYGRVHQSEAGRWGDKNNFYLNHIGLIAGLFPEARFLHIVRDGRDVACSYRELAMVEGNYAPELPNSVLGAARHWRSNLSKIERSFKRIGRKSVHEMRYEDLVTDPEKALRSICHFLGESYAEEMVAFDEENRKKQLEPAVFDSWKGLTREKLSASRVGRWRTAMFTEDIMLFEMGAGGTLKNYGYPLASLEQSRAAKMFLTLYYMGSNASLRFSGNVRRLRRIVGKVRRTLRARLGKNA